MKSKFTLMKKQFSISGIRNLQYPLNLWTGKIATRQVIFHDKKIIGVVLKVEVNLFIMRK